MTDEPAQISTNIGLRSVFEEHTFGVSAPIQYFKLASAFELIHYRRMPLKGESASAIPFDPGGINCLS